MSIRRLPDDVIDKLKSSTAITSLNAVVIGLLANSLDAGADKINISVDYSRGNCMIEDNGSGILPEEFKDSGGLGRLHHTSKLHASSATIGSKGNFLASLATLSLLAISSRHRNHLSHNSVLLHHSQVLARHLPAPAEQRLMTFSHGTRVSVRDLFGSMPVRVKQRAILVSERSFVDREWSRLVDGLVATLLPWCGGVSVLIREASSQRELRLSISGGSDLLQRASRLLAQASIVDPVHNQSWVSLSASSKHASIKGCVSLTPFSARRAQFVSIGVRPVGNEHGANILYEEINKTFSDSRFGAMIGDPAKDDDARKEFKHRKSLERWPAFYFHVTLRDAAGIGDTDSILENTNNSVGHILDLLKAMCYGFLKKHHYLPKKMQITSHKSSSKLQTPGGRVETRRRSPRHSFGHSRRSPTPSAGGMLDAGHTRIFQGWPQIKVGHASAPTSRPAKSPKATEQTNLNKERLIGSDGRLLRPPFDEQDMDTAITSEACQHFSGNPLKQSTNTEHEPFQIDEGSSLTTASADLGANLTIRSKHPPDDWLQEVLDSWTNPVFGCVPTSVPRTYDDIPEPLNSGSLGLRSKHFDNGRGESGISFRTGTLNFKGRISKTALASAEVVSQVDEKFILIQLQLDQPRKAAGENTALAMLDQHAVDERCRLEDLMDTYFARSSGGSPAVAVTELLPSPLKYEVDAHESDMLEKVKSLFHAWGIVYHVEQGSRAIPSRDCTVRVSSLPPSILERCSTEPRLLIDLIREHAWKMAEGPYPSRPPRVPDGVEHPWVTLFGGCPRGILELLHSRSCRSAVMFNDALTKDECEALVKRVARCAFPFQCAHGRPSMAPLVDLGMGSRIGGWVEDLRIPDWRGWS